MIQKPLKVEDYVVVCGGSYVGRRGLVIEIDPDGISLIDFDGNEIVCSPAHLSHVMTTEPVFIKECFAKKTMNGCGVRLPMDAFYHNATTKDGRDTLCKACRRANSRDRAKALRFPARQATKRRRERNALVQELLELLDGHTLSLMAYDRHAQPGRIKEIRDKLRSME